MLFQLSAEQANQLADWRREHQEACQLHQPGKGGAIGGSLTYAFTPNNLGMVIKVTCACGSEVDLSDYENW